MKHPKRAWLLAGSGLSALALVAGGFFIHYGTAAASPTADSTPITYIAQPPMKALSEPLSAAPHLTPEDCLAAIGILCYSPSEVRTAYNIPAAAQGAGQTIVIVDAYGSPTIQTDLQEFDAAFGLPDPTLNIFYPTGRNIDTKGHKDLAANWAGEVTLDVEWSHAIAPQATIDLVIASSAYGDVLNVAQRFAIQNHLGNVMSLSFGASENAIHGGANNTQLAQAHANYVAAQAAGMTVFASAGDSGATNGTASITANYPASDPLVTGVGGTNLFISDDAGTYSNETVWNDSNPSLCPFGCQIGAIGATGGAPSVIFPGSQSSRVSYNASLYTGVLAVEGGSLFIFGGTSAGSPQWAGLIADADAMAGHSLGYLNPTLTAIGSNPAQYATDFHDVTVGDNGFFGPGFSAGTGVDQPTGLGSPNAGNLLNDLTH